MTGRTRSPQEPIHVTPEEWEGIWHLDKRIPVALILTMVVQLIAGVWWASQLNADVQFLKQELTYLKIDFKATRTNATDVARLQIEVDALKASITKVEKTAEIIRDRLTLEQTWRIRQDQQRNYEPPQPEKKNK